MMSRKDFTNGMAAGARPFAEMFKQQANAINQVGKQLNNRLDDIQGIMDIMQDDLSAREKKELYDLNTMIDIAELEDTEKEFLLSVLYTLANMTEEVMPQQRAYLRSVKKYLGNINAQTQVDLSCIENIDSKRQERAILQVVMEFLFLENCNHDYWDEYDDVLDYFSVKNSEIRKIQQSIDMIYKAVGAEGLAEKYGYVQEDEETVSVEEAKIKENYLVDYFLKIEHGEERKITDKNVVLSGAILCEGKLIFENCTIECVNNNFDLHFLNNMGHSSYGIITLNNGILIFENCTIKFVHDYENMIFMINAAIDFIKCKFEGCRELIYANGSNHNTHVKFTDCVGEIMPCRFAWYIDKIDCIRCKFTAMKPLVESPYDRDACLVIAKEVLVSESYFEGFINGVFFSDTIKIEKTKFIENKKIVIGNGRKEEFSNKTLMECEFDKCFDLSDSMSFTNLWLKKCKFTQCVGKIEATKMYIEECTFTDGMIRIVGDQSTNRYTNHGDGYCLISNSEFKDVNQKQLKGSLLQSKQNGYHYVEFMSENDVNKAMNIYCWGEEKMVLR